ncbi:MAG: hypothetical protein QM535_09150 [Limnohabitans sp.]|nr:hypothetical protein [Limnohabitans sp.]
MTITYRATKDDSIIVTHYNDNQKLQYVATQNDSKENNKEAGLFSLVIKNQIGNPQKISRDTIVWRFNFLNNWFKLCFQRLHHKDILPLQSKIEQKQIDLINKWEESNFSVKKLTKVSEEKANKLVNEWSQLADNLIVKHSDGYINRKPTKPKNKSAIGIRYPSD